MTYNPNCVKIKINMKGQYRIVWERGKDKGPIILQDNILTKDYAAKRKLDFAKELGLPAR